MEGPVPASLPPPPAALVPPPIISPYGTWLGAGGTQRPWQHYGIDIRVPAGTPVLAAADGTVARVGEQPNSGKFAVLSHGDDLASVYWHLSEISVRADQVVRRGEMLGRSGMTGNATTPHLHFGVCRRPAGRCDPRIDGGWDDPTGYWTEGTPCYDPGRAYPALPIRLTYPVPCAASA